MPISPQEVREAKELAEKADFTDACKRIDSYLKIAGIPAYWDCSHLSTSVIARVIAAYTKVGWKVTHETRDGACLVFDEK